MSDSTIVSTSDAFTRTQRCAVDVLLTAWTIRPEGEDVDDLDDVLGLHLERAVYEEIAKGLAEVARRPTSRCEITCSSPHSRSCTAAPLPATAGRPRRRSTPAGIPAARHLEAHLLDAHLE
jgi:hypothetical protein